MTLLDSIKEGTIEIVEKGTKLHHTLADGVKEGQLIVKNVKNFNHKGTTKGAK